MKTKIKKIKIRLLEAHKKTHKISLRLFEFILPEIGAEGGFFMLFRQFVSWWVIPIFFILVLLVLIFRKIISLIHKLGIPKRKLYFLLFIFVFLAFALTILLSQIILPSFPSRAATAGPNNPSVGADDASVGTVAWSTTTNIYNSDNTYATVSLPTVGDISHYLKATGFGFAIPAGSTINGITVNTEIRGGNANKFRDNAVRIVKGGTISATDRSSATQYPTTDTIYTYGNTSDLWGETWTAADINSANFGVAHSSTRYASGGASTVRVDHFTITVTYTANTAPNAPTLVSPANGSSITDNTPILSANYSDPDTGDTGTTNYRISSGTAQNCLDNVSIVVSGTSSETADENEDTTWTPGASIGIDGTYYWCAQNNDGALTSAWTSMGNFVLDTTGPTLVFTDNVAAGPVLSDTITATWGDATVTKWDYDTDGTCSTNAIDYSNSSTSIATQTDETNNTKYICLYAEDSLGNKSTLVSANDINIDATKPTVSNITVNDLSITEVDIGIDNFFTTIDFSETMDTGTTPTVSFNPAVGTTLTNCSGIWTDSDTYTYTCDIEDANITQAGVDIDVSDAKDFVGNIMLADTITGDNEFDINTNPNTAPNAPTLVSPANGSSTTDNTPTLSANYSDPDTGDTGTANYRISSGTAQNCLDNVNTVAFGASSTTSDENEDTIWAPGTSIGIDGTYYWCAQNNDGALTSAWTSMGNFVLDTTGPTLVFTDNVAAGPVLSDTITATWGDATVTKWDYDTDGTCSTNAIDYSNSSTSIATQTDETNNTKYICLYAEDSLGNKSTLVSANDINIDVTDPVIIITAPTKSSGSTITDTTINVTDNDSVVVSNVTVDASTTASYSNFNCAQTDSQTVDCTIDITGSGDLTIKAIDDVTNQSTQTESGYTISSAAPIIAITAPTKTSNTDISDTTINITDSDGILVVNLAIDASTTLTYNNFNCIQTDANTVDCTIVVTSSGNLVIEAVDNLSNSALQAENGYIVDTIDPIITITAPTKSSGSTITDTTINVTDNNAILAVDVTVDISTTAGYSGFDCTQTNSATVDCTIDITLSGDLTIKAIDTATNQVTQIETGYTISSAAPTINIAAPTKTSNATITDTTINIIDTDGVLVADVNTTSSTVTLNSFNCTQTNANTVDCTINITGSGDLVINATDSLSNLATVTESGYIIDTNNPNTTIDSNPSASTTSTSATFTFSSDEAGTFECKLDSGSYSACVSPKSYSGLSTGSHTFYVRAIDSVGNIDTTPASYSWTITSSSGGGGGGGGSTPPPTPQPTSIIGSGNISSAGGGTIGLPVVAGDSDVTVNIPAGITNGDISITLVKDNNSPIPPQNLNLLNAFDINAYLVSNGQQVFSLNGNVTITIFYGNNILLNSFEESSLQLYYWNETTFAWVLIPSTLDQLVNIITAQVNHFSTFAVFGTLKASGLPSQLVPQLQITPEDPSNFGEYIVQAGDDLRNIAFKLYRNEEKWSRLVELNKTIYGSLATSPNVIGIGWILKYDLPNSPNSYSYELISQSSYPSTLKPGEKVNVWIEVKNTGLATWFNNGRNGVRLGTGSKYGNQNQQRDYTSEFADVNWLSPNRPTAISNPEILPGWHTRFQFDIKAPTIPGNYKAYFTPVIEGYQWMKDIGIYWEVKVEGDQVVPIETIKETPDYDYEFIAQSSYPSELNIGNITNVWVDIKNTGKLAWDSNVKIGSGSFYGNLSQKRDYPSEFANSDWLSPNRPVNANKLPVQPGETARFQFNIKAPIYYGDYKAYFTPVVDGVKWMRDIGMYWEIKVNGTIVQQPAPPVVATGNEYTVVAGDTLKMISLVLYGTMDDWVKLVDLNKDRYPSLVYEPNVIGIGWIFRY